MLAHAQLGALRHAARRWRVDRLALAVLVVTIAVTAALAAAVPRLATRVADEALQVDVARADDAARTLRITTTRVASGAGDGFLETETARAAALIDDGPPEVRRLAAEPRVTLDARRFIVGADAGPPAAGAFVTVRAQPGLETEVKLVAGRLPAGARFGKVSDERQLLTVEVAMSSQAAAALDAGLGNHLTVAPDPNAGPAAYDESITTTLALVGIFEPLDADAPYWAGRAQLLSPSTFDMGESQTLFATVAADSHGLAALAASGLQVTATALYPLDLVGVTAAEAPRLAAAFDSLPVAYRALPDTLFSTTTARSGLGPVLERFIESHAATGRLLSVALASLAGVAFVTLVLLALMLAARRRAARQLDRQRGASAIQVLLPAAVEALSLGGGSALCGFLVAAVLLPGGDDRTSLAAASLVAGIAATAIVGAAAVSLGDLRRRQAAPETSSQAPSRRRLVAELTTVLLAGLGIYLLRSRGLAASPGTGVDPFLAAVPLLAALAMALVVLRLYPLPLLALAAAAGRGRGLTAAFGLRRAGTGQRQHLPVVALLLATALGVFGLALAVSIGAGQALAALEEVGADYRVEAVTGPNPSRLGIADLPGVEAAAATWVLPDAPIITATRRGGASAQLLATEVDDLEAVTTEPLRAELHAAFEPGVPLPALISSRLGPETPIQGGERFSVVIGGQRVEMLAVERRGSWPAVAAGDAFVVVALPALEARLERTLAPTQLLVRGRPGLSGEIRDRALDAGAVSVVLARDETLAEVREAPFSVAVVSAYAISLAVAAAYVTLAVVIGLLLGRQARERDLAHLRTMGLGRREAFGLVALEQLPMPLIGVAAGSALGLGLVALIGPGLDLASFVGTTQPIALAVPWTLLVALGLGFAGVMLLVTLVAAMSARAVDPARALRLGET